MQIPHNLPMFSNILINIYTKGQQPTPVTLSIFGLFSLEPSDSFTQGFTVGCCVTLTALTLIMPTYVFVKNKFFSSSSAMEPSNNSPEQNAALSNSDNITLSQNSSFPVVETTPILSSVVETTSAEPSEIIVMDNQRCLHKTATVDPGEVTLNLKFLKSVLESTVTDTNNAIRLFCKLLAKIENISHQTLMHLKSWAEEELIHGDGHLNLETIRTLNSFLDYLNVLIITF